VRDREAAADLYATALERVGTSSLLRNNVEYLAQEWARAIYAKGGPEAVAAVTKLLVAKFPGIESVSASGAPAVIGAVNERRGAPLDANSIAAPCYDMLSESKNRVTVVT
jgi:hypothetical protein